MQKKKQKPIGQTKKEGKKKSSVSLCTVCTVIHYMYKIEKKKHAATVKNPRVLEFFNTCHESLIIK